MREESLEEKYSKYLEQGYIDDDHFGVDSVDFKRVHESGVRTAIKVDCCFSDVTVFGNLCNTAITSIICSYTRIHTLETLPLCLTELYCNSTMVSSIPIGVFPNLLYLDISNTNVSVLDSECLPGKLVSLDISTTKVSVLPLLPHSLKHLYMTNTLIRQIEKGTLPPFLEELECTNSLLTTIDPDVLPESLVCISLNFSRKLRELPNLQGLTKLYSLGLICTGIQKIHKDLVPRSLVTLSIDRTKITTLENLRFCRFVHFSKSRIKFVDNVVYHPDSFTTEGYYTIKRFQKRYRYKLHTTICTIQAFCHNWIWKPSRGVRSS